MSTISFTDEKDLQRKICTLLNKHGYQFEKGKDAYFCDIFDPMYKAYGEVKTQGNFAPQQLLYGLAKEGITDSQYLILANEFECRVYKSPPFEKIAAFAMRISKDLGVPPSSVTAKRWLDEGFNLLGLHTLIYNYKSDFKIDDHQPCIFLDNSNYEYFQLILTRYRIDPSEFINKFAQTWTKKSRLFIKNDNQTIVDLESNHEVKAHRNILNKFDRVLIQSTRIRPNDVEKIIHKIDELTPQDVRRKRGKYWSNLGVSEIATELVKTYVNPTLIFEPFVGGGSLVRGIVGECKGIANDIDKNAVDLLEQEWEGYDWTFHRKDILRTPLYELDTMIPELENEEFVIYTNPPFGTASTNALASNQKEIDNMTKKTSMSRKNPISYGADKNETEYMVKTYGKGDLCIPCIGKMIEMIKRKGKGALAFFSPFGVMLGRHRYLKVLKALLKDFEFVYGEVFSGAMFNNVAKKKSISFTIWKYNKNIHTILNNITFFSDGKEITLRQLPLLKDGWKYDTRKNLKHEIVVNHNAVFNDPSTKRMLHLCPEKGGSEIIKENVIKPLNIPNLPDELLYAMWSMTVGYKAIYEMPFLFNEAIVHLPNFSNETTIEICAYTLMYALITEIKNNNCNRKIGFIGMSRIFQFGGKALTKGAQYLLDTYHLLPIGTTTIGNVFHRLKANDHPDDIDKNLRKLIKREIELRLDQIGYWEYLPIPKI